MTSSDPPATCWHDDTPGECPHCLSVQLAHVEQAYLRERERADRTEMIGAELLTQAVSLRAELEAERGRAGRLRAALCDARREVESVKVGDSLWNLQARREALRLIDEVLSAAEEGQSV